MEQRQKNKEFEIKVNGDSAIILRCFSYGESAVIPSEIDGYKVTELAPYAFSAHMDHPPEEETGQEALCGERLEEIVLPDTIEKIGRYAFYNCRNLKRLKFSTDIRDISAGAFTGCHQIREMDVTVVPEKRSCFRELLIEIGEEQEVMYHCPDGDAKLIFPEYFEEAVENTPARILVTKTHGSGMWYRNCIVKNELQFDQYDKRFAWAVENEREEVVVALAFARLLYPYRLSEDAREQYENYLSSHVENVSEYLLKQKDMKLLTYYVEHCIDNVDNLRVLIDMVGITGEASMMSYLMEQYHQRFAIKEKKKKFDL